MSPGLTTSTSVSLQIQHPRRTWASGFLPVRGIIPDCPAGVTLRLGMQDQPTDGSTEGGGGGDARGARPHTNVLQPHPRVTWTAFENRPCYDYVIPFVFLNVYLFLRPRETEQERGASERGRHRIRSRLQGPSRQHRAPRGAQAHEP